MRKLEYQARRPYLTEQNIVEVIAVGEIPSKFDPRFRFLSPGTDGIARLQVVFAEARGLHTEVQSNCRIVVEFGCPLAVDRMIILGDGEDLSLPVPSRQEGGGNGGVPTPP